MCGVPHDSEQLYSHEVEEVALSLPSLLLLTTRRGGRQKGRKEEAEREGRRKSSSLEHINKKCDTKIIFCSLEKLSKTIRKD
jgi:hypothetical protein